MSNRRLQPTAVPSIFPNVPAYLTKKEVIQRTDTSSSSSRFANDVAQHEKVIDSFLSADEVNSFQDLKEKIRKEILPSGINIIEKSDKILFCSFKSDDVTGPQVLFSLSVFNNLSFKSFCNSLPVPVSNYSEIVDSAEIKRVSQVLNILANLKSKSENDQTQESDLFYYVNLLSKLLNKTGESFIMYLHTM